MYKTYKSYESLEGKVIKALKKSIGSNKSTTIIASVIAVDIWNRAKRQSKVPTDTDISFGIYEYLGAVR